tara:strand:+ start:2709 stop:3134 length:426 start_codon:yes stop_codon:yes gene_type:complete
MLTLELPFPVSVNQYWKIAGKRMIKSKVARAYIAEVTMLFLEAKARHGIKPFGPDDDLSIAIAVHYPMKKGRANDLDNLTKICIDALETAGVFPDDNQFRHVQISREKARGKGSKGLARVTIKKCKPELKLDDKTFKVAGL